MKKTKTYKKLAKQTGFKNPEFMGAMVRVTDLMNGVDPKKAGWRESSKKQNK